MIREFVCTITPNPVLDLGGIVDNLRPNEKSYVHDQTKYPGGNAINVSRILTRLNIPVLATGFLGGSIGQEIKLLLDYEGVKNQFIKIKDRSRIGVTVSNKSDHRQTRLSFPGPHIMRQEKESLNDLLRKKQNISLLVIGGSLPQGFSQKDAVKLMKIANKKKIRSIIDCPGNILREFISHGPLLIKPNLDEFHELINANVKSIGAVRKKAQGLLDKVPYVCVSSVEGGTLLVTRNQSYFGRIPPIKIKSTVGAGDSMVGAMVAQLYKGNTSPEELLRWGLAASAATLSEPGTTLGNGNEVRRLYDKTTVELV